MLRKASNTWHTRTEHAVTMIDPVLRILRHCTQMQRQVNRYY